MLGSIFILLFCQKEVSIRPCGPNSFLMRFVNNVIKKMEFKGIKVHAFSDSLSAQRLNQLEKRASVVLGDSSEGTQSPIKKIRYKGEEIIP